MTPTTLALVERLANDASSGNGAMLIGIDEAARFFALAMEHAAGIAEKTMPRYNWASERCAKLAAWLQWCLDNCDDCPEWNFGTTATGHIRSLLAGGDAPMPPTKP